MLNIGTLNENKDGYLKRDERTVNPFVEINSEVLGKCVTYLEQRFNKQEFLDEEIKKLVDSESFAKIYGTLLLKVKAIKTNGVEGKWVKYNGGSESEAERLYNSLQGYNTGWCTAGSLNTAIEQVCGGDSYIGGDFYVYYSKDENEVPQYVSGYLDLSGLINAKDLTLPKNIGGNLYLGRLWNVEDLVLSKSVGGYIYLGGLRSAKGLVMPENIGGNLVLENLINVEGLVLPKSIGRTLFLSSVTSAKVYI